MNRGRNIETDNHPGREECLKMLKEYNTPEHVVRHCLAVTDAAVKIGQALNAKGFNFNIPLIESAGLLHDIARAEKRHWKVGARLAFDKGFIKEAKIIKKHMDHPLSPEPSKLTELDIVCLGDRTVLEDQYVGMDARMDYVAEKAKGDKRIIKILNRHREINRRLIRNIENIVGARLDEIIKGKN